MARPRLGLNQLPLGLPTPHSQPRPKPLPWYADLVPYATPSQNVRGLSVPGVCRQGSSDPGLSLTWALSSDLHLLLLLSYKALSER
jgi:hypothetical protein